MQSTAWVQVPAVACAGGARGVPRVSRRRALRAAAAALGGAAARAWGVCGEPDPDWAHLLRLRDGEVVVGGGRVHFRVAGDARKERRAGVLPVVCVARPGESVDGLDGLELLGRTERRVVRADLVGAGDSVGYVGGDVVGDAAAQLAAVLRKVGVRECVVFCAGAGAARVVAAGGGDVRAVVVEGGRGGGNVCAAEAVERGNAGVLREEGGLEGGVLRELAARAPLLVVGGEAERRAAEGVPGCRFVEVDSGGRLPHYARLDALLEAADAFYSEVEGGAKA